MIYNRFTSNVLAWYAKNKRTLPWRETRNAYFIWLSEIILQQTRVIQGTPYYLKFVEAFPTLESLAQANEQQVLALWQGLGYYSRARNLHKCSKKVMEKHGGIFPDSYNELLTLPGIGPYTAAAIASLAYNRPKPVVDGNVYRVLSRVFGLFDNIADAKTFKHFFNLSEKLIDRQEPGSYNQAVMELGATVCLPQKPICSECPVEEICYANAHKKQEELPVKINKVKKRDRYFTYLVLEVDGRLALRKRIKKDIWEGMFEFYLIENDSDLPIDKITAESLSSLLSDYGGVINDEITMPKHLLSHQTLYSTFLFINIPNTRQSLKWMKQNRLALYTQEEIETLPKPVLISRYLNSVLKSINLQ